ncbi:MAG: hypothetical protein ACOYK8_09795 [Alphaproteobacteria bacterium]
MTVNLAVSTLASTLPEPIEWDLDPKCERLVIAVDKLSAAQMVSIQAMVAKNIIKDKASYERHYYLRAPTDNNPEHNAVWDASFPDAEKRLYEYLQPALSLPWKDGVTSSRHYHCWRSELTPEQQQFIQPLADDRVVEENEGGDIFIGFRNDDVLYELRNSDSNRLYGLVRQYIEGNIERNKTILAAAEWVFEKDGTLTLIEKPRTPPIKPKFIAAANGNSAENSLTLLSHGEQLHDALQGLGVESKGGIYQLHTPNTVAKLYDRPDGETDRGRIDAYEAVHDATLALYQPIIDLPWQFDTEKWAFVVQGSALTPEQQSFATRALVQRGAYFEMSDLASYTMQATGPKAKVEELCQQLAQAAVAAPIDIGDLASLNWHYNYQGLSVSAQEFKKSQFYKNSTSFFTNPWAKEAVVPLTNNQQLALETDYDGQIVLREKNIQELPYYAAVKHGIEQRFAAFVQKHAEEIKQLPWSFSLADNIRDYGAVKIYAADVLTPQQQQLVEQLVLQNQLKDHQSDHSRLRRRAKQPNDGYYDYPTPRITDLLPEICKAEQQKTIQKMSEMPWEYHQSNSSLYLGLGNLRPDEIILAEKAATFRRGISLSWIYPVNPMHRSLTNWCWLFL